MKYFVLFLMFISVHAHAQVCNDIFRSPLFAADASLRSINLIPETLPTDSNSPEFKAKLADLLDMWTAAIFHEDTKDPLKKRPLSFGRMISATESVEFEYQADTRSGSDIYRLTKVKYFKGNGQDLALAKEALTDDGTALRRSSFTVASEKGETKPLEVADVSARAKDLKFEGDDSFNALRTVAPSLSPADQALLAQAKVHNVEIPLVLDGPMLESLKVWLSRMPKLKYEEVAAAAGIGSVSRLYWLSSARNATVFWAKNSKKQVTKMIFWVAVIATVGHLPGMSALMSYLPMHSRIEKLLHPHNNNVEDAEKDIVKTVFSQSKQKNAEIAQSFTAARKTIKDSVNGESSDDIRSINKVVSTLSEAERKAGGTPVLYSEALLNVLVTANHPAILKRYVDGFEKSYVIAEFKKQSTVLLIPVVEDQEAGTTRVTVLRYTTKENPETYTALSTLLARKVVSAQTHNRKIDPSEALAD